MVEHFSTVKFEIFGGYKLWRQQIDYYKFPADENKTIYHRTFRLFFKTNNM